MRDGEGQGDSKISIGMSKWLVISLTERKARGGTEEGLPWEAGERR